MKRTRILAMTALLTAAAAIAFAQQGPATAQPGGQYDDDRGWDNPGSPGRGNAPSEEKREEIRKKVEAIRIWKLTEELKLDANTSAKLSSLLSSLDRRRRDLMREQMETMRELRVYLKAAKPNEAKIRPALDKLESNHREMQELREREWKGLKEILTTEQQARFLVFQQKFQREMRGMIAGARGGGMGQGGKGMGGGPMQGGTGRQPDN